MTFKTLAAIPLLSISLFTSAAVQANAGWYVSGDVGTQVGQNEASHSGTNSANTPSYDLDGNTLGGVAVGYDTGNKFRFEGELRKRKLNTDTSTQNGLATRSGDTFNIDGEDESVTLMANVLYDIHTASKVKPYLKAGVGYSKHKTNAQLDGSFPSFGGFELNDWDYPEGDDTNFTWALGAGVSYPVKQNLSIDLEYQYIDMGDVSTGVDVNGDRIDFDTASHEVTAGITYRF